MARATPAEVAALQAANLAWIASLGPIINRGPRPSGSCVMKRGYESANSALAAHADASFSVRAYRCERCGRHHVANVDKR